jgi:hypothetical protein
MAKLSSLKLGAKSISYDALKRLNLIAAVLYGLQAILILVLSNSQSGAKTINTSFLSSDKLSTQTSGHASLVQATHHLFDLNLAYVVAAFLLIGLISNFLLATRYRKNYEADLKRKTIRARWVEYALTAGIMMSAIALVAGVFELSLLLMIFGTTLLMGLLALVTESNTQATKKVNWLSYWLGLAAGVLPWIIVIIYLWGAHVYNNGLATYVYWIVISMLLLFASLIINRGFQYKKLGHWENYLFGERMYMILIFLAQSALAWQIFFGTLRG